MGLLALYAFAKSTARTIGAGFSEDNLSSALGTKSIFAHFSSPFLMV